jgi:2-oxoisovalerate dehydrogenase E2 component (dihydrolipoyl transacylase)
MTTFLLPDLGEGLTEAEIVAWHVNVGDQVVAGQPLVSVETAKAVVEIPAPWSGRIAKAHGNPGDVIPIGTPLAEIETEAGGPDAGAVVGTLPSAERRPAAGAATRAAPPRQGAAKVSPAVRRRASELGVDLARITGTGPGGSVTMADIEGGGGARTAPAGYVALTGVRRAMAEAMTRSGAEVVAATVTDEAVVDAWSADTDPTIRLVRAVVAGCRAAPELNAWYDGRSRSRRLHDHIDLGIATETADGLFVPVLRNVANRTDSDLRSGLDALKRDVSRRSVPLAELQGQTITLSNFGMLGGLHAALTVMPPQVAILGAGRIHRAARIVGGEVRAVAILPLSLTFDHRAVTGAEALRFLSAVIGNLST